MRRTGQIEFWALTYKTLAAWFHPKMARFATAGIPGSGND